MRDHNPDIDDLEYGTGGDNAEAQAFAAAEQERVEEITEMVDGANAIKAEQDRPGVRFGLSSFYSSWAFNPLR